MKPKIYVRKARNFSEVFGDTFGYLKQNFKSLMGCILLLVAPFVFLSIMIAMYMFNQAAAQVNVYSPFGIYRSMFGAIFWIILISLFAYTAFFTILNQHMILNDELPPNEKPQIKDVLKRILKPFLLGLWNMFVFTIFNLFLFFIIMLILAAFSFLIKASPFIGVLLVIIGYIFLLLIVYPIQFYLYSAVMFTAQREKINVFRAIGKVFKSLKGNFWMTWCASFIGGLMTYILSVLAFIPSYAVMMIAALSRVRIDPYAMQSSANSYEMPLYVIILFCLSGVLLVCIASIYFVMMNMQSASNQEKKDGVSIIEKIESI